MNSANISIQLQVAYRDKKVQAKTLELTDSCEPTTDRK